VIYLNNLRSLGRCTGLQNIIYVRMRIYSYIHIHVYLCVSVVCMNAYMHVCMSNYSQSLLYWLDLSAPPDPVTKDTYPSNFHMRKEAYPFFETLSFV
jgi:hypothetical protein